MKLHHTLPIVALACLGASANAANVYDWGALGPVASGGLYAYHDVEGALDDVFTFTLADLSDVDAYGKEFEARSVGLTGASFTLWSGVYGSGTATIVGTPFAFNDTATEDVYSALAAGSYYFEVKGTSTLKGVAYDFEAFADNGSPPSTVPEPADAALLVAGMGMLVFMGRRRNRS
ncbi:MAG: FxDxF family PEP-CTERM protein [Betaproteobacteria bacterium]